MDHGKIIIQEAHYADVTLFQYFMPS